MEDRRILPGAVFKLQRPQPEGFAADYQRYAVDEDAPDFYQWLFQCGADTPVERLPERAQYSNSSVPSRKSLHPTCRQVQNPRSEKLLPEQSGIRRFAADYQRYAVDEDAPDFYQWKSPGML